MNRCMAWKPVDETTETFELCSEEAIDFEMWGADDLPFAVKVNLCAKHLKQKLIKEELDTELEA